MVISKNCPGSESGSLSTVLLRRTRASGFLLIGVLPLSCVVVAELPQTQLQNLLHPMVHAALPPVLLSGEGETAMWKSIILALLGTVALSSVASAACSSFPYTLTNGTSADASQVMANFNCVLGSPVFSGPVGIGTVPSNFLDVSQSANGDAAVQIANSNTGANADALFIARNGLQAGYFGVGGQNMTPVGVLNPNYAEARGSTGISVVGQNGPILFASGGLNEVARFDTSGQLDLGATSYVYSPGPLQAQSASSTLVAAGFKGNGSSSTFPVVGVAVNSSSGYAMGFFNVASLTVTGSITNTTTGTAYNTSSDERLKIDRGPAWSSVSALENLHVHDFVWRATGKSDVGLFAQEAYKVLPEIVTKGGNDPHKNPWQVNYPGLIPRLLVGWQNHEKRIQALQEENVQLLKQIKAMKELKAANDNQAAQLENLRKEVAVLEEERNVKTAAAR